MCQKTKPVRIHCSVSCVFFFFLMIIFIYLFIYCVYVLIRISTDRRMTLNQMSVNRFKKPSTLLHARVKPIIDTASSATNKNKLLAGTFCSWGCVKRKSI